MVKNKRYYRSGKMMNVKKLREIIKQEIEKLEAELTNLTRADYDVKIEIESWIDCCEWILTEIDKK